MPLVNEINIAGRVATEPLQAGRGPYKFRLAHGGGGTRKDGTPWPTQWFSVACWDAKIMAGVAKGDKVEIFGKLRDSTYTKDGTVRYGTELVADAIVPEASGTATKSGTNAARAILSPSSDTRNIHGQEITDEDIPF